MKQENNKVADKLPDGLEDITFGDVHCFVFKIHHNNASENYSLIVKIFLLAIFIYSLQNLSIVLLATIIFCALCCWLGKC
jgi:hypothetical protein